MTNEERTQAANYNRQCESQMQKDTVANVVEKPKTNEERTRLKQRAKRYYFLKLPSGFSGCDAMYTLYTSADTKQEGLLMQYCYMRMLELSIKHEGSLMASSRYPYTPKTLGLALGGFDEAIVKKVVSTLSECGFIEIKDNAVIYMNQLPELIASSSEQAIQKRKERLSNQTSEEEKAETERLVKLAKTKWLDD